MNELREINELVQYLELQLKVLSNQVDENINNSERYLYFQGKKVQVEEVLYKINKICLGK